MSHLAPFAAAPASSSSRPRRSVSTPLRYRQPNDDADADGLGKRQRKAAGRPLIGAPRRKTATGAMDAHMSSAPREQSLVHTPSQADAPQRNISLPRLVCPPAPAPMPPLQPSAPAASIRPRRSASMPLRYRQPDDDAGAEDKPEATAVAEDMSRPAHADALQREVPRPKRHRGPAGRPPRVRDTAPKPKAPPAIDVDNMCTEEPDADQTRMLEEEEEVAEPVPAPAPGAAAAAWWKRVAWPSTETRADTPSTDSFVGNPVPDGEARRRWPHRYSKTKGSHHRGYAHWAGKQIAARCHYTSASVDDVIFNLNDDVFIKAGPDEESYMGRITEFFEGTDHGLYFTCRWFFRVSDTVISPKLLQVHDHQHNDRRVFLSEEKNDNLIESIICKLYIVYVDPDEIPQAKDRLISNSDFYYDMSYSLACSTFANMRAEMGCGHELRCV